MKIKQGTRVLITGAGSGIGAAIALDAARRGARVFATDINLESAQATAEKCRAFKAVAEADKLDVSSLAEWEHVAAKIDGMWSGIDLLVNNAGIAIIGRVGEIAVEAWQKILTINQWGVIYGCHVFVPRLKAQRSGYILNVASLAGLTPGPEFGPYSVSKAAVVALTETLALELRGSGVGVSVLCPGFLRTNIFESAIGVGAQGTLEPIYRGMTADETMTAEDVARAALDAVGRGRIYILPMATARRIWRAKRLAPEMFLKKIWPLAEKQLKKRFAAKAT